MASTFGISTQDTWTGPYTWPGTWHEITNVRFSHKYGGGPATLTFRVVVGDGETPIGIAAGKKVRVWRGAENIWTGVITQPDTGGDGIGVTADGLANLASRWICTPSNALLIDQSVDAAIARGLPWRRGNAAPTNYSGYMPPGTSLFDALNKVTELTGVPWNVDAGGNFDWGPVLSLPQPDYLLWAWGQGGARTMDNFGTDFYATYQPLQDYVIDDCGTAPTRIVSGAAWTVEDAVHYEGTSSLLTTGASRYSRTFTEPISLLGYQSVVFYVSSPSGTVTRTYNFQVSDGVGTMNPPAATVTVKQGAWAKVVMDISGAQSVNFGNLVRYDFQTDGSTYVDNIMGISPVPKDRTGNWPIQLTADQSNDGARLKYDRWEVAVDLTGQGQLPAGTAIAIAQTARDKYGYRTRWTQPFAATTTSLTNLGGAPVDVSTVLAGSRVRVLLADLGAPEVDDVGSAVEFVIWETEYDEGAGILTLTPVDAQRKDLLALLGNLPKGRTG